MTGKRKLPWISLLIILLLLAADYFWIWNYYGRSRQDKYIASMISGLIGVSVLLIWVVTPLSGLSRGPRRILLGGFVLIAAFLGAGFEIKGVTGDLLPVFRWRWGNRVKNFQVTQTPAPEGSFNANGSYPQFGGPARNGVLELPEAKPAWFSAKPKLLWKTEVGPAWSGFVISGNYAVTQEQNGEEELISCFLLSTGARRWMEKHPDHYQDKIAGEGPRATPCIANGRVFAVGAKGFLSAHDLQTGKMLWSTNLFPSGGVPEWGVSCSPLIHGETIVVTAEGGNSSLIALDAATGKKKWSGGSADTGYCSPYCVTLAHEEQCLIFQGPGLFSHKAGSGQVLWMHPWPGGHPHIAMPIVLPGDKVLLSSGYGTGSELLEVKQSEGKWTVNRLWKSVRLKSKFANLFHRDGFIYGLDDGIMACIDARDGSLKWKEGRYGHGQMIEVGDVLGVMAESGDWVWVRMNPEKHEELAKFSVLKGKTWNPPALAGKYLLVRNDREAACFELE